MSEHPAPRRRRPETPSGTPSTRRRLAELWRAAAIGFTLVWTVLLVLVVAFWVRVTFYPRPGDDLPGSLQILLAPVAAVAAGLVVWSLVCGWRLVVRRASGCDAIVVLGAFAIAVGALVWVPGQFLDHLDSAPGSTVVALVVLGTASVTTGLLAQRAFRRAAVGLEPSEEEALEADEAVVAGDPYAGDPYAADPYARDPYAADPYAADPYAEDPSGRSPEGEEPYAQDPYAEPPRVERGPDRRW